jgi:hypothetical protein
MDFRLLLGLSVLSHPGGCHSGGGGGKIRNPQLKNREEMFVVRM